MGTSSSAFGPAPHLTGEIHMGEKLVITAEPAISGIGVCAALYRGNSDDRTHACGDFDGTTARKRHDTSLAPPSGQSDVHSGLRKPELPPLLLLSRDLHSACRDLHLATSLDDARCVTQCVLPGFDPPVRCSARKHRRTSRAQDRVVVADDDHVRTYLRRLAVRGTATKGIDAYRYQLGSTVRAASRLRASPVTLADVFRDAPLLGRALIDDRSSDGPRLSKWTLAQRRSAIRSFANLMRPELLALLGEEPADVVDRALRSVAERIGGGYRLTGGAPRPRGGRAPLRDDVAAVLRCLGCAPDVAGLRNQAFFGILAAAGCRVNALRLLDGSDWLVLPTGRMRLYLQEKGKVERREIELSHEAACDLVAYTTAVNRLAESRRWASRVEPGKPGSVWWNSAGRRWGYASVLETLKDGCIRAAVPEFAPHALRRAFASDAASRLPRHVVALAGGWQGVDRLDDHYVQPRGPTIWEKLSRVGLDTTLATTETEMHDAAVGAL